MLLSQFHNYLLCMGLFAVIFTEPIFGFEWEDSEEWDPFHPSFMDAGNYKKGYRSPVDQADCDSDSTNTTQCDFSSIYRTYDGSCNNMEHPTWGQANDCHLRLLEASYEGADNIRQSVHGGPLPNPRVLTNKIFTDYKRPSKCTTFIFTIFGQMVAHDVSLTLAQTVNGSCCSKENSLKHSQCAPVFYPPNDPFYSKFNVTCLDVKRSKMCDNCNNAKRQQPNAVTAALDGSVIYGTNEKKALELRTKDGTGRMISEETEYGELLPRPDKMDSNPPFCPAEKKNKCFKAGDSRVNQHSTLMSMQTLWLREHNRIAEKLGEMNPHWDDETRYQQARKIVGAEIQNIVYSEYLTALLGQTHMDYYHLSVQKHRSTKYNPHMKFGMYNEFATAVFRLHSMVPTEVGMDHYRFLDYYGNPCLLRKGKMDRILQGTCEVPSEKNDRWFVNDVSRYFNKKKNESFGRDLVSTDLQRNRDHGTPTYVKMLSFLTKGKMHVTHFNDLLPIMSRKNIRLLEKNYKDVCDVDLYAGVVMEYHVKDSNLGPTACALASMQFHKIKFGDRYYFEHGREVPSFTPDQRESLKKSSLSRIICDNTHIQKIQKNCMLLESEKNPLEECCMLPSVDLSLWED